MIYIEDRLRTFARLITQNFSLKVHFAGSVPSITTDEMFIPPLKNTKGAFQTAKCMVAHECGHEMYSVMDLKDKASKEEYWLGEILNCLEDARIERLICERFEGLKSDFLAEVSRITNMADFRTMPLHEKVLHGLYLRGIDFNTGFLTKKVNSYLDSLSPLIRESVSAKNSYQVLDVSRKVLSFIKDLLPEDAKQKDFNSISEMVEAGLDEHKIQGEMLDIEHEKYFIDGTMDDKDTVEEISTGLLSDYQKMIKPYFHQQSYLIQHIKMLVDKKRSKKRKSTYVRNKKSGIVDIGSLWKIATDKTDIFKARQRTSARVLDIDPDSFAFYLLLDVSSSMARERIKSAKEAVAVFGEVLNILEMRFAVTAYSTGNEKLIRIPVKRFSEDYSYVKTKLTNLETISGTFTSENIPFAQRRLMKRPERKKVLVVITDADCIESEYRLNRAIERVRSEGIYLVGIGIRTDLMNKYFDRFIEINDLKNFGKELLTVLRDVLR